MNFLLYIFDRQIFFLGDLRQILKFRLDLLYAIAFADLDADLAPGRFPLFKAARQGRSPASVSL